MEQYDIIVIGAGASGLIAAWQASLPGYRVLLVEKNRKAGVKLSITGKGRCNITNTATQAEFYKQIHPRPRFLKHAFSQFFSHDIIRLLNESGVETVEERGGRVFPASGKASDVVRALITRLKQQNVDIIYEAEVSRLLSEGNRATGIVLHQHGQSKQIQARGIILCTGGKSYAATGSDGSGSTLTRSLGHTITPLRPALVPLETQEHIPSRIVDLTLKNVQAVVWIDGKKMHEAFGEMFFIPQGLSGPIILTLSRFIVDALDNGQEVKVTIDLKPALDEKKLDNRLLRDIDHDSRKRMGNLFRKWLPAAFIPFFMDKAEIDPHKEAHQLEAKERKKIKMLLKAFPFNITQSRPFKEAIITAGGVSTHEVDSKTLESKVISNLYFAGEIMDLDGNTGGYNLQIAWSTGWLAGKSLTDALR